MAYTDDIECPKCKHKHWAAGNEDDAGEQECEECGFAFRVEIEYDPSYDCECITHEFGEYGQVPSFPDARLCKHCGKAELRSFNVKRLWEAEAQSVESRHPDQ